MVTKEIESNFIKATSELTNQWKKLIKNNKEENQLTTENIGIMKYNSPQNKLKAIDDHISASMYLKYLGKIKNHKFTLSSCISGTEICLQEIGLTNPRDKKNIAFNKLQIKNNNVKGDI